MDRTCSECGDRLPVTLARSARFCGGACKQKSYRRRRGAGLPVEMTRRSRWLRHDENKVPLTVLGRPASVVDPLTWSAYEVAARSTVGAGLGFVLGGGVGCIDLDHCITGGRVVAWAQEIIDAHRGEAFMVERSMSGDGVHIFLPMPEGRGSRVRDGVRNIEIYSRDRYIAVTGVRL